MKGLQVLYVYCAIDAGLGDGLCEASVLIRCCLTGFGRYVMRDHEVDTKVYYL